jgi:hypothetical protein
MIQNLAYHNEENMKNKFTQHKYLILYKNNNCLYKIRKLRKENNTIIGCYSV